MEQFDGVAVMQASKLEILIAARRIANLAIELGVDIEPKHVQPVYDHMGALLADAVLQAGLNYKSVVMPRIARILELYPERDRVSRLVELSLCGETAVFLNWTHAEKIARFDSLVRFLGTRAVETVADLKACLSDPQFALALRSVRGVGPKTLDYMGCLVGIDTVAVDRHIKTFAKRAEVVKDDYDYLQLVFCYAADLLSVSRRDFDGWVWRREAAIAAGDALPFH